MLLHAGQKEHGKNSLVPTPDTKSGKMIYGQPTCSISQSLMYSDGANEDPIC